MAKKRTMSGFDNFGYYLFVVITLGGAWLYKTMIIKALVDADNDN